MYRVIKASAGDIRLFKFIVIPTDYIGEFQGYRYDENVEGYIDIWSYFYNKLTRETDDRLQSHADHIDQLPFELKKIYRQCGYWGKTDLFKDKIRFYVNDESILTNSQVKYLKSLCR